MAMVNLTFHSYYLGTQAHVTVLLPEKMKGAPADNSGKKYPVLYLLHGHSNDDMTYITQGNAALLCRDLDLIVVMPSVCRSFYTNAKHGYLYYDYMTKELPIVIKNYFPISSEREETYIAGLSMGGYGAFMLAMKNPDKFAAAASMSGAMDACFRIRRDDLEMIQHKCADMDENMRNIFGSPKEYDNTDKDLYYLAKKLDKKEGDHPRLFLCCGLEDELHDQNLQMKEFLEKETNLDFQYKESHGIHNWYYWNKALVDVLKFCGFEVKTDTYN